MDTMWACASDDAKSIYGKEYLDSQIRTVEKVSENTNEAYVTPVIEAMVHAVTSDHPKYRYLIDGGFRFYELDEYCVSFLQFKFLVLNGV